MYFFIKFFFSMILLPFFMKELFSSCLLSVYFLYTIMNMSEMLIINSLSFMDWMAYLLISLSLLICYFSFFMINNKLKLFMISMSCLIMILYFMSDSILNLFILFELSLIPMVILIMGFGFQPERLKAGRFMFIYTVVASSSLLISLLKMNNQGLNWLSMFSFNFLNIPIMFNMWIIFGLTLAFLVKIPSFLIHFWLPKAHVEAPLEGSMILAGVMLKMGLYGMIRFMTFMFMYFNKYWLIIISLFIIGSIYSCWMAITADDLKMIVAYSSISHMNFSLVGLMSYLNLGISSCTLIMVSHGFSSSSLFFLVTLLYNNNHSRSSIINKGYISIFPSFSLVMFMGWCLNMASPPSISFLGEVFSMMCLNYMINGMIIMSLMYIIMNSFFSILNYGISSHSSFKVNVKSSLGNILSIMIPMYMFMVIIFLFFSMDLLMN
uniref:NADH dehydrogenase subunit 4 n=1 Tax=Anatoecus dentatus TaxID=1451298 RepID=UPI0022FD48F7|nr:NADH dehydrogenase subunit 4 [Anatoecus dentatus]WAN81282.1 NADH dehydrogenase subunit 4 [Anatoecus dentatus]